MSSSNPLRNDRIRQKLDEKVLEMRDRGLHKREEHSQEVIATEQGIRIAPAYVHIETPSHTRGTSRGEEWIQKKKEKGRVGTERHARSATSINPLLHDSVDHRMPHLPPA
ncbi:MAG: hypothetical protein ACRD1Y_05275 [Terriglobales bacterium]